MGCGQKKLSVSVAVHRSPGICLTAEEYSRKPQLGDHLMKGLCDQSSPQMGPFPPDEVGRIAGREKDENKERTGLVYLSKGRDALLLCFIDW